MPAFTDTHDDLGMSYEDALEVLDCPGEFEMTDWEANFLDSLMKQAGRQNTLTDAQATKLRQMVEKYIK
jgi:hypothetical protein